MTRTKTIHFSGRCQRGLRLTALILLSTCAVPARAVELTLFDDRIKGSIDTTIATGVLLRTQERDHDLIGTVNGDRAYSVNNDDGNLNYSQGDPTSAQTRLTHELQLSGGDFGTFVRFFYFYDPVIQSVGTRRTALSKMAKRRAGLRIQLLDAYATGDFDVFDMPLSVRIGNQVISWGERDQPGRRDGVACSRRRAAQCAASHSCH